MHAQNVTKFKFRFIERIKISIFMVLKSQNSNQVPSKCPNSTLCALKPLKNLKFGLFSHQIATNLGYFPAKFLFMCHISNFISFSLLFDHLGYLQVANLATLILDNIGCLILLIKRVSLYVFNDLIRSFIIKVAFFSNLKTSMNTCS